MSFSERYNHVTPIQVRFADIDSMNHVNNARYLTYIESARINYMSEVLGLTIDHSEQSVILAKAEIDFQLPIMLGDQITVHTRCSKIGNKSLVLDYNIVKQGKNHETLVSQARTILVAFNYKLQQTISIPDEWKETINSFEKISPN